MDVEEIWIVEEQSNPSTEYYILPAFKVLNLGERIRIFNNPKEILKKNIIIIFVRYLTKNWIKFVEQNKDYIKKIIYFMDDDLFDLKSYKSLPLRYIKKIYLKAYRWKRWLIEMKADFFVSTEYLAKKYSYMNPLILPPYPVLDLPSINEIKKNKEHEIIKVFYYGTASHTKEIKWLHDIVKAVILSNKNIIFEFVGNDKVYKIFQSLERVIVVHPMKWNLYKIFLLSQKRHIGLVPMIDNNFNRARSYTKFFEFVSCGAVGVYSEESCYKDVISNETDGILLSNDKTVWIENILLLAENDLYRLKLYSNSLEKLNKIKELAEKIYKDYLIQRLE